MKNKITKLEEVLIATVCTETAPALETITCACGTPNARADGQMKFGDFMGSTLVAGCNGAEGKGCEAVSRYGNVVWQHRHGIARFLRGMADALLQDRTDLLATIPTEIGRS